MIKTNASSTLNGDTTVGLQQFLRQNQVTSITGLSRSTIYRMMERGMFPRPVPLGERAVGWLATDIASWQAHRTRKRSYRSGR